LLRASKFHWSANFVDAIDSSFCHERGNQQGLLESVDVLVRLVHIQPLG
jgi:hypothetical protein